ncbi:BolA/IbaG family iron-sulfur metabolism protein [Halobacterium rubrum]|uniref:BolA/IbaG family iron-sulfur metabolism protein n=1 Tax=Halobacterium TaxID=2239 RepID=UPI001F204FDE|nr:BolA/IbaG family iron-sulfur metabolism protein [Halobacterium rubrum]MDH5021249.1 BolA/IbaG family iron-sulfur metabolism protein [Halobacterium rubrum]
MDRSDVEARIEAGFEADCGATVSRPRGDHDDDDHLEATVVSSAFEGESLVAQHELVSDTLGDATTTESHALELTTYTPDEADEREN